MHVHFWLVYAVQIKSPMIVVGTSLGGAIAMDFALEYPQAVKKLVLVDAQGFIDGLGPWRVAPKFLINLLVQVSHQRWRQPVNCSISFSLLSWHICSKDSMPWMSVEVMGK